MDQQRNTRRHTDRAGDHQHGLLRPHPTDRTDHSLSIDREHGHVFSPRLFPDRLSSSARHDHNPAIDRSIPWE
jgi:hypothetical protein